MLIYMLMIDSEADRSKFEKIYLEYKTVMLRVANKILCHKEDAEDAVHQAFVKIAEHIEEIGEPVCPKTKGYVVIIVENKAIDIYRKRQRHPTYELNEATAGMYIEYTGQDELTACMAKLPARQREVILLKYKFGYNNGEVAKILGISQSNAIKIDQRAKKALYELCGEVDLI